MDQGEKFRKEVLGFLKKQNYGSQRLGPFKSDQSGNNQLAEILMDVQEEGFQNQVDALGTLGKELADKLKDINEAAIMGDAASQALLLEQLKAYKEMIPLLEEGNEYQKDSKNRIKELFDQSEMALKSNSRFYNRLVEGAKAMIPAAGGILTAMTAKSPIAGAMVNFALEKFQARQKRKEDAKEDAMKALIKTFGSMSTANSPTSPMKVPSGLDLLEGAGSAEFEAGVEEGIIDELKALIKTFGSMSTANSPTSPMKVPSGLDLLEGAGSAEFEAGVEEGIIDELKQLNDDQMEELKVKLSELFEVNVAELQTVEQIARMLAPIASEEAALEAERQMDEQNDLLRKIAKGSGDQKDEKGGFFAIFGKGIGAKLKAFMQSFKGIIASVGAFLAIFRKNLFALFTKIGAIPLTLGIAIGKGFYDAVQKWLNGGTFSESLAEGLKSTGNLLTFGLAERVGEWLGSTEILDPVFSAYDSIVNHVSDAMTTISKVSKQIWDVVSNPMESMLGVYNMLKDSMSALFDEAALAFKDPQAYARNIYSKAKDSIRGFFVELIPSWVPERFLPQAIRDDIRKYRNESDMADLEIIPASSFKKTAPDLTEGITRVSSPAGPAQPARAARGSRGHGTTGRSPAASSDSQSPTKSPINMAGMDKSKQDVMMDILSAADEVGVNPDYLLRMAKQESSFDPNAQNPNSSAGGLFQFLDSTWIDMMKQNGSKYGIDVNNMSRDELLALKKDSRLNSLMGAEFAKQNAKSIGSNDVGDLYLAHFAGAGAAKKLMSGASPQEAFGKNYSAVMSANPYLQGKDSQGIRDWASKKMQGPSMLPQIEMAAQPNAELATGMPTTADMKIGNLQGASESVKQAEVISRAKVESRNSVASINQTNVSNNGGGGGTPTGGTASNSPRHLDPTLGLADPVLT